MKCKDREMKRSMCLSVLCSACNVLQCVCVLQRVQEAEYKRKQKAKRKQRDGLQEDLVGPSTRGMGRGAKGGARRSNMDAGNACTVACCSSHMILQLQAAFAR